jgi:hypothetical protein
MGWASCVMGSPSRILFWSPFTDNIRLSFCGIPRESEYIVPHLPEHHLTSTAPTYTAAKPGNVSLSDG